MTKQRKPRKSKPLLFSLTVKDRDNGATIIDEKEKPLDELKSCLRLLERKL